MPVVNDDLVTKFMTTMRQDQGGNTYSPHTQFKDIMSVSSTMKVEGTLMDDDFSLYEQQAFGNVYNGNNNATYNTPVVTNRRSAPINYNNQQVPQQYPPQRINQPMQMSGGNSSHLPSEIMDSLKNNPIDQSVFDHRLASNQQANYIVENTRMDLFESSVNPTQSQMVEQPNISYNPNINESIQPNYQQPHVIKNNVQPNMNIVPNSGGNVDYSFINKIVKDAINEGLNNLNNPNSNKLILQKDGKKYSGKISQQKSGRVFFILDGEDYLIELIMGDIKKIKK